MSPVSSYGMLCREYFSNRRKNGPQGTENWSQLWAPRHTPGNRTNLSKERSTPAITGEISGRIEPENFRIFPGTTLDPSRPQEARQHLGHQTPKSLQSSPTNSEFLSPKFPDPKGGAVCGLCAPHAHPFRLSRQFSV